MDTAFTAVQEFSSALFECGSVMAESNGGLVYELFTDKDRTFLEGTFLKEISSRHGLFSEEKLKNKHSRLMGIAAEMVLIAASRQAIKTIIKNDETRLLENVSSPLNLGNQYRYEFNTPYHGHVYHADTNQELAEFEALIQREHHLMFLDATVSQNKNSAKSDALFMQYREKIGDLLNRSRGQRGYDMHKIHVWFTRYQELYPEYAQKSEGIHIVNVPLLLQVQHVTQRVIQTLRSRK